MRDFKFTEQERPTMANFNARFDAIAALANGLSNDYVWAKSDDTGIVGYVNSQEPNAYPPAVSDGYTYTLLGKLGESFGRAKIETGSYVGTGTYGDSNPNSLTFGFDPKVVAIISGNSRYVRGFMFLPGYGFMSNNSSVSSIEISMYNLCVWAPQDVGTNTVSWHNASSAAHQLNDSGVPYNYIAIG